MVNECYEERQAKFYKYTKKKSTPKQNKKGGEELNEIQKFQRNASVVFH